jgi:hydroxyacylglutathione hydrolase
VPSRLGLEKKTNPFLRYDDPEVVAKVEEKAGHAMNSECAVFSFLRQWKDSEYD